MLVDKEFNAFFLGGLIVITGFSPLSFHTGFVLIKRTTAPLVRSLYRQIRKVK
jgi:hypothetical protein